MKEELSQAIARALSSGTGMSHSASRRKPLELPTAGSVVEDGPDITTKHDTLRTQSPSTSASSHHYRQRSPSAVLPLRNGQEQQFRTAWR